MGIGGDDLQGIRGHPLLLDRPAHLAVTRIRGPGRAHVRDSNLTVRTHHEEPGGRTAVRGHERAVHLGWRSMGFRHGLRGRERIPRPATDLDPTYLYRARVGAQENVQIAAAETVVEPLG